LAVAMFAVSAVVLAGGCAPSKPPENTPPTANGQNNNSSTDSNATPGVQASAVNETVANIRGDDITAKELLGPLIEANGLDVTLELAERALARQAAAKENVTVSPDEIANETKLTIERFRKAVHQNDVMATSEPTEGPEADAEAARLLEQFLQYQHIGRSEFDIRMETNAYLRKIAAPKVDSLITDKALLDRFNTEYGEKVEVRYVMLNDVRAVAEVKRELSEGQKFEDIVRARSLDPYTRETGGLLPPFTRQDARITPEFKQVAFDLKPGEVSDPITAGKYVALMQKIRNIPPTIVKFEDYKDSLRQGLYDDLMQQAIGQLREELGLVLVKELDVRDPVLKQQWADKLTRKPADVRDATEVQKRWQKIKEAATRAATQPTTQEGEATTNPTTAPADTLGAPVTPSTPIAPTTTAPTAAADAATPATAPAR
jgi:hypothetical protein